MFDIKKYLKFNYSNCFKNHHKDISAIMAYNGGWASVMNWKKQLEYVDMDDFIEKIPYPETQDYIKKVLKSYWNYCNIY